MFRVCWPDSTIGDPTVPGPPPKPIEQHRKLGNPSKMSLPDPEATGTIDSAITEAGGLPEPLRPLGPDGLGIWEYLGRSGAAWIGATDLPQLQHLCELHDERAEVRRYLEQAPRDWRERINLRRIDAQIGDLFAELGLTPAARTRLGLAQVRMAATIVDTVEKAERAELNPFEMTADLAPHPPKLSWTKARILEWFELHGIPVDSKLPKQELIDLVSA